MWFNCFDHTPWYSISTDDYFQSKVIYWYLCVFVYCSCRCFSLRCKLLRPFFKIYRNHLASHKMPFRADWWVADEWSNQRAAGIQDPTSWWDYKLFKSISYLTQAELSYSQKRVCNELSKLKGEDTDVDENSLPPCSPTLEVCECVFTSGFDKRRPEVWVCICLKSLSQCVSLCIGNSLWGEASYWNSQPTGTAGDTHRRKRSVHIIKLHYINAFGIHFFLQRDFAFPHCL